MSTAAMATIADQARVDPKDVPKFSSGHWSFTHVDKTLEFGTSFGETEIGEALQAFAAELSEQIVEQMCCDVPAEEWGRDLRRLKVPRRLPRRRFNPHILAPR